MPEVNFPIVRQPDGKGGYVELYKCWKHGLTFVSPELAAMHYSVDHLDRMRRRSGYSMDGGGKK